MVIPNWRFDTRRDGEEIGSQHHQPSGSSWPGVYNVLVGSIIKDGEGKTPTEIAPGTKVYELVEELVKYFPEEIQNSF